MHWPDFITFASDATRYAMAGAGLLTLSALSIWGEKRRMKRSDADAVGFMPWRDIAALSTFAGLALLAFGVTGWLSA